jgi:hypothetical protein
VNEIAFRTRVGASPNDDTVSTRLARRSAELRSRASTRKEVLHSAGHRKFDALQFRGATPIADRRHGVARPGYGDYKVGGAVPGKMTVTRSQATLSINWEGDGTLQSAASVTGPWTDVGATKPYSTGATSQTMYFRVKGQ